jgi:hypothetical protein
MRFSKELAYQIFDYRFGFEFVRVLEQHKVLELLPRIESEVVVLILSEKVADLLLENPLCVEGLLELVDGILEPLHLLHHPAYLRHEGIYLVVLLEQLSFTDLSAD